MRAPDGPVRRHLDQADLAGSQRPALFQVAEGWNIQADLAGGLQHRPARGNLHALSVNGYFKGVHAASMALMGQTLRQVSHRVQSSWLISCLAYGAIGMAWTGQCWAHKVQPLQAAVT